MLSRKNFTYLLLILSILGCNRNDPDLSSPSDLPLLQPIHIYNIPIPEPSGLAYNFKDTSLWVVSDANSTIYKIDFYGNVLKSFIIPSSDLEGIAFTLSCDTLYVAEETNQLITKYTMSMEKLFSFPVNVATNIKHGPEGVTVNNDGNIVVINEKLPCMILEYDMSGSEFKRKTLNYSIDISDICYSPKDSAYWIVSDESKMLIELAQNWELMQSWSIPVNKAEGIAIVEEYIYIVSDADSKLYQFQKPK